MQLNIDIAPEQQESWKRAICSPCSATFHCASWDCASKSIKNTVFFELSFCLLRFERGLIIGLPWSVLPMVVSVGLPFETSSQTALKICLFFFFYPLALISRKGWQLVYFHLICLKQCKLMCQLTICFMLEQKKAPLHHFPSYLQHFERKINNWVILICSAYNSISKTFGWTLALNCARKSLSSLLIFPPLFIQENFKFWDLSVCLAYAVSLNVRVQVPNWESSKDSLPPLHILHLPLSSKTQ